MKLPSFHPKFRMICTGLLLLLLLAGMFTGAADAQPPLSVDVDSLTPTGQTGGIALAVETQGSYAYVGVGPRIHVYNVMQPGGEAIGVSPILSGVVRSITAAGDSLFAVLGDQGVQILDIADPTNPNPVGHFKTDGRSTDVAVAGNYAFVTSVFDSFRVFDISDRTAVTRAGEYSAVSIAQAVEIAGDYAYLAAGGDGLVTVDISTPSNPQAGGQLKATGYARDVVVAGSYAYLADGYGNPTVVSVNVASPESPSKIGGYQMPGEAYALALVGERLYATAWSNGLFVLNVNTPNAPVLLGNVDTPGRAVDVAVAGGYAVIADDWGGWRWANVTDVAHPTITNEMITPGEVSQVAVDGAQALILDNSLGAFPVDVANPAQLTIQGRSTAINGATDNAKDLALMGSHAYAIDGRNVRYIDISIPDAPTAGGTLNTPGQAQAVSIYQNKLFVADGEAGLQVYGLANPASPTFLGNYATTPDEATKVLVNGNTAFLVANGLHVVDVTNPTVPTQAGYYKPDGLIFDMALAGHRLYLSGGFKGIWTLNVSNPATPTQIGYYEKSLGYPIAATEQGVFVVDQQFDPNLTWFDMNDPTHPTSLGTYPTAVRDMTIVDGTLYVAANWTGLMTFPVPQVVTVSEVRPNQGRAAWANQVNVYGSNFMPGITGHLVKENTFSPVSLNYLSASHLQAVVPAGTPSGVYGLRVTNPDNGRDILDSAYTVIPENADILYAYADELWVGPYAARQNIASGVGLVVHRAGGNADRTDVTVDFYVGDPNAGGQHLGQEAIPSLSPNSYVSTLHTPWTPATEGAVALYGVINPGNLTITRTVDVLPPAIDAEPPVVNSIQTAGTPDFSDASIDITISASDNSGGSGVSSIYVMEFDWNPNGGMWVKTGDSGWLDYTGTPMALDWTLNWSPGVKNLVAWAGDRAGNVSIFNKTLWINFIPTTLNVNQGMWQVFSYWLDSGRPLSATSTPVSGDPDLYLCCNSGGWLDSSINEGSVPDTVSGVAPAQDIYSVGVYGWTTSRYALVVSAGATQRTAGTSSRIPAGVPALPQDEAPPQALQAAPTGYRIYLPSTMK